MITIKIHHLDDAGDRMMALLIERCKTDYRRAPWLYDALRPALEADLERRKGKATPAAGHRDQFPHEWRGRAYRRSSCLRPSPGLE